MIELTETQKKEQNKLIGWHPAINIESRLTQKVQSKDNDWNAGTKSGVIVEDDKVKLDVGPEEEQDDFGDASIDGRWTQSTNYGSITEEAGWLKLSANVDPNAGYAIAKWSGTGSPSAMALQPQTNEKISVEVLISPRDYNTPNSKYSMGFSFTQSGDAAFGDLILEIKNWTDDESNLILKYRANRIDAYTEIETSVSVSQTANPGFIVRLSQINSVTIIEVYEYEDGQWFLFDTKSYTTISYVGKTLYGIFGVNGHADDLPNAAVVWFDDFKVYWYKLRDGIFTTQELYLGGDVSHYKDIEWNEDKYNEDTIVCKARGRNAADWSNWYTQTNGETLNINNIVYQYVQIKFEIANGSFSQQPAIVSLIIQYSFGILLKKKDIIDIGDIQTTLEQNVNEFRAGNVRILAQNVSEQFSGKDALDMIKKGQLTNQIKIDLGYQTESGTELIPYFAGLIEKLDTGKDKIANISLLDFSRYLDQKKADDISKKITSEYIGTGTGAQDIFYFEYYPVKNRDITIYLNSVELPELEYDAYGNETRNYTINHNEKEIKFNEKPANGVAIRGDYYAWLQKRFYYDVIKIILSSVGLTKVDGIDEFINIPAEEDKYLLFDTIKRWGYFVAYDNDNNTIYISQGTGEVVKWVEGDYDSNGDPIFEYIIINEEYEIYEMSYKHNCLYGTDLNKKCFIYELTQKKVIFEKDMYSYPNGKINIDVYYDNNILKAYYVYSRYDTEESDWKGVIIRIDSFDPYSYATITNWYTGNIEHPIKDVQIIAKDTDDESMIRNWHCIELRYVPDPWGGLDVIHHYSNYQNTICYLPNFILTGNIRLGRTLNALTCWVKLSHWIGGTTQQRWVVDGIYKFSETSNMLWSYQTSVRIYDTSDISVVEWKIRTANIDKQKAQNNNFIYIKDDGKMYNLDDEITTTSHIPKDYKQHYYFTKFMGSNEIIYMDTQYFIMKYGLPNSAILDIFNLDGLSKWKAITKLAEVYGCVVGWKSDRLIFKKRAESTITDLVLDKKNVVKVTYSGIVFNELYNKIIVKYNLDRSQYIEEDELTTYDEKTLTVDARFVQQEWLAREIAKMYLNRYKDPYQKVDLLCKYLPQVEVDDNFMVNLPEKNIVADCKIRSVKQNIKNWQTSLETKALRSIGHSYWGEAIWGESWWG